jgi:hypothetical protein
LIFLGSYLTITIELFYGWTWTGINGFCEGILILDKGLLEAGLNAGEAFYFFCLVLSRLSGFVLVGANLRILLEY